MTPRFYFPVGVLIACWLGLHDHALAKRKVGCSRAESLAKLAQERAKLAPPSDKPVLQRLRRQAPLIGEQPWLRPKPPATPRTTAEPTNVDPREPLPEYRCKTASPSQCRDTHPNQCSSQASELRARSRLYGKLANPANIGMSVPLLPSTTRANVMLAVAPSAIGLKWRLRW